MYATICTTLAWTGFIAGTGRLAGPDPREMAKADMVVIWGTNPVNTQVNVMTHADAGAQGARRQDRRHRHLQQRHHAAGRRGARACGRAPTARSPAPSCTCCSATAIANWPYLEKYTDCPRELEAHLETRTPEWASAITGLSVAEIETFAQAGRHHAQDLLPPRLRLCPLAQRRPQHARGAVHPVRDRRLAARGRRRLPQQRRHLPLEQDADRGPRRRRPQGAHARSVAHRPGADGRSRRYQGRAAGHGAVHPEHQPGPGGARAAQGEGRASPARTCSCACTSSS